MKIHLEQIDKESLGQEFVSKDIFDESNIRTIYFVRSLDTIKLPFSAEIININSYSNEIFNEDIEIMIEKISEEDFNNGINNWNNILSKNIIIPSGTLNDNGEYKITNKQLDKGDLLRIKILNDKNKINSLTTQIDIKLI